MATALLLLAAVAGLAYGGSFELQAPQSPVPASSTSVLVNVTRLSDVSSPASVLFSTRDLTASSGILGAPSASSVTSGAITTSAATDAVTFSRNGNTYLVVANGAGTVDLFLALGDSQFELHQSIAALTPKSLDLVVFDSRVYLAVANSMDSKVPTVAVNSAVYIFDDATGMFALFQSFATSNCSSTAFFTIPTLNSQLVLGVIFANYRFVSPDYQTNSVLSPVYLLDAANGQFTLLQQIPTTGATAVASFTLGETSFLTISEFAMTGNNWLDSPTEPPANYSIPSSVYAWTGLHFTEVGVIDTLGARDVSVVQVDESTTLLMFANLGEVALYKVFWNSVTQQFFSILFQQIQFSNPLSLQPFRLGTTLFLAVASEQSSMVYRYFGGASAAFDVTTLDFSATPLRRLVSFSNVVNGVANSFLLALSQQDEYASTLTATTSSFYELYLSDASTQYGAKSSLLRFAAGEATRTVSIALFPSQSQVAMSMFQVTLSSALGTTLDSTTVSLEGTTEIPMTIRNSNNEVVSSVSVVEGNEALLVVASVHPVLPSEIDASEFLFTLEQGDNSLFAVGTDGSVYVLQTLNRQSNPPASFQYSVLLRYSSQSSTAVGLVWLTINVLKSSEVPIFLGNAGVNNASFEVTVLEQQPAGTSIVALKTDVSDQPLLFTILASDPTTYDGIVPFSVDNETGVISTNAVFFKVSVTRPFQLTVAASPVANPSQVAVTTVLITVLPLNNLPPRWTADTLKFSVPKTAAVGTLATSNLEATVADILVYTTPVKYSLLQGNEERFFRLDTTPSFARLVLIKPLEYETGTRFFNISVSACTSAKSGIPASPLCSVVALEVTIANVNVFPVVLAGVTPGPNTASKGGRFFILEDLPVGSPVFRLSFTDQDVGEFGMITYSLRSPKTKFDLLDNNATVVVSSLGSAGSHSVFVLASDGFPATSFSYITTVVALDRPAFDSASYTATIAENSAAGTPVVRVSASVMQEANRSMFLYSIEDGNLMNTFTIDPQTGQIALAPEASLDYESQPNTFTLTVKCVETWSSLPRDRTVMVSISVENVNDNAPTLPLGNEYSISVSEDDGEAPMSHAQRSLFTVEFADVDGTESMTFSIASSLSMNRAGQWTTDLSLFELVPSSNQTNSFSLRMQANATLDAEQFVFHMLTLTVFDGMFSVSAHLNVTVDDLDDNAPVFPSSSYSTSLTESIAPSTVVMHVMVTDRDDNNMLFGSPEVVLSTSATMPYQPVSAFAFDNVAMTLITTTRLDASQSPYLFYMIASDTAHTVIATVNISVSPDVPYFINSPLPNVTVDETLAVNGIVAVVEGASHHQPNPTVTYSLPGDGNGNFVIGAETGIIRLAATLDAQTQSVYELVVQITQFNGQSMSTTLWVTVTDLFSVPPTFTAAAYFAVVQENTAVADLLQVMATVQDSGVITYAIDQSPSSLFSISSATGLISCQALDIEELGMQNVTFSVVALFEGLNSTVSVTVMILDQNDVVPAFQSDLTTFFSVPEDVIVGTQVTQVVAMDGDFSAPNNEIVYQLEPLSAFFAIDAVTGAITVKSNLFNQIPVNENNLTLTVVARDNGVPSQSASLTLTIEIVDRKPPQFLSESSSMAIPEGVRDIHFYTALVLKRENFPLSFTFELVSVRPEGHVFSIDANSGVVSTVTSGPLVSFSRAETYNMTIRATDNRGLSSELIVQVPVLSRSAFAPVFEPSTYTVTIPENSLRNSKVVDVRAFIRNLTTLIAPSVSGYSLDASTDVYNIFAINNVTGEVTLRRNLYGVAMFSTTSFTVSAFNAFYTPFVLSASARVVVNVVGVNLFAPIFQPGVYVPATLQKNASVGTSVLQIRALDQDRRAPFNTITYSILGDRLGFFTISSDGRVTVARSPLNRMTTGGIAITIRASDGASPALFVERSFLVPVIETNDASPTFSSSHYVVTIPSQTPVNSTIFTAFAPDADDAADTTTYSLAASSVFGIDPFTGRVFVKANAPARTVTTLALTATDGIPILSSFSSLVVRVLPEKLAFASSMYSAASITPNTPAGTVLANTSVLDMPDYTAYPALTFAIESVKAASSLSSDPEVTLSSAPFAIDQSGVVTVTDPQSLSGLSADLFWINIVANNDSSTVRATVMVNVSHADVRLPKFAMETSNVTFPEAQPAGSQQIVLSWTYAAISNVVFEVLAGSPDFNVTFLPSSVVFTTTTALMYDFDGTKSYVLSVKVSDALFPSLSSTAEVLVTVLDVNNQAPVFTQNTYPIAPLFEQVLPPSPLAVFAATDADAPGTPNSAITYSLSGPFATHFALDSTTGVLSLVTPLLYSATPTYELVVTASDAGVPQQQTSVTIRGNVTEIIVSAPTFATVGANFSLDDYKPAHLLFTALATAQPDILPLDETAPIQYSLEGADADKFNISSSTGEVFVVVEANFDVSPMYTFEVVATKTTSYVDGIKSARLLVVVTVVNTFDPKPYFLESNFSFVMLESSPAGVTVGSVVGFRDEEMGNPNTLMYSISTNDFFAINEASGLLTAKTELPSNQQEVVSTIVTITDRKGYTASVPVTITIVDQNNNAPIFQNTINGSYTVEILQNTSVGTAIVQAFAVDADGGQFGTIVSYEILSGAANTFAIDQQTGLITVSGILTTTPFVMVVQATDGGQSEGILGVDLVQRTSVVVTVNVVPVDLFNPVFELTVYNATIDEKPAAGLFIAQVVATDADYLEPPISYSIVENVFSAALSIDAQSGVITSTADAAALLNADVNGVSFSFSIKATAAGPTDVGFTQLSIALNPLNDNPPMFVGTSPETLQIDETMPPGVLGTYRGVDADFGLDGVVTHTLVGADASLFALDSETGVLHLLESIPYAPMAHMFSFSLVISDGGSPSRNATKTLTVEVLPVNRFAPVVTSITVARLFEGSYSANDLVATVVASDEDSLRQIPAGATVSFALLGENAVFSVDAATGAVRIAQDTAFSPSSVTLNVRVSDDGMPARFVDVVVQLIFLRYPDPPSFTDSEYSVAVNELTMVGAVVLNLAVVMPDPDFVLAYELSTAGTYDSFAIDATTGELRVAKPLNRSLKASYSFSVSAAYVANPTRKVETSIKVTVDPATLLEVSLLMDQLLALYNVSREDLLAGRAVLVPPTLPPTTTTVTTEPPTTTTTTTTPYPYADVITYAGDKCAFPFVYNDKTYTTCTLTDFNNFWCSTSASYDNSGFGICKLFAYNVTVQNKTNSDGLGFALKLWLPDGSPTDPFVQGMDLIAVRGETYAFVTDETTGDHPLYITSSPEGGDNNSIGNPDVQGNFATNGGVVYFSPTARTPSLLYYQSSNGRSFGGRIIVVDPDTTTPQMTTTPQAAVLAAGGNPVSGGFCNFPFTYRGRNFSSCTCEDIGQAWCALSSNFDEDHLWGYCQGSFSCPAGAASGQLLSSPFMGSSSETVDGKSSSSSSSNGVIAGSIVGVVALVAVAVVMAKKHLVSQRVSFSEPPPSPKRAFPYVHSEEDGAVRGSSRRIVYASALNNEDSL